MQFFPKMNFFILQLLSDALSVKAQAESAIGRVEDPFMKYFRLIHFFLNMHLFSLYQYVDTTSAKMRAKSVICNLKTLSSIFPD